MEIKYGIAGRKSVVLDVAGVTGAPDDWSKDHRLIMEAIQREAPGDSVLGYVFTGTEDSEDICDLEPAACGIGMEVEDGND